MADNNLAYALFLKTKELIAERQEHVLDISNMDALAYYYRVSADKLKLFFAISVAHGLLDLNGKNIYIHDFSIECREIEEKTEKKREAGALGGKKKQENKMASQSISPQPETVPEPQEKSKQKKEPDIELSENGKLIRMLIDRLVADSLESLDGLRLNKKCSLSNKQIEKLLTDYGYSKAIKMTEFYYEWKLHTNKTRKDDFAGIRQSWCETKAAEYLQKHGDVDVKSIVSVYTQADIDKIVKMNADRERMGLSPVKLPEVGSAKKAG